MGYWAKGKKYRLSPEAKYPAAVNNLITAVKWIKVNANVYNIDATCIAVLGISAGATLAILIGTTAGNSFRKYMPIMTTQTMYRLLLILMVFLILLTRQKAERIVIPENLRPEPDGQVPLIKKNQSCGKKHLRLRLLM